MYMAGHKPRFAMSIRKAAHMPTNSTTPERPHYLLRAAMIVTVAVAAVFGCGDAQAATRRAGHVYLMRGIFNVFSLGMDQIAYKLQGAGVAATVHNHTAWRGLADDMVAKSRSGNREPIILMGHSAGADATIDIARKLQES